MIRSFMTALSLAAPASALAAPAHNHGEGQLAIVLEGETLTIELVADLMDLVGFEHAPQTAEQKAAIEGLHTRLKTGAPLFTLSGGASCALQTAMTEGGYKSQPEDDHDHEGHDEDDHSDHDHDDHDDHEKGHDDDDHDAHDHDAHDDHGDKKDHDHDKEHDHEHSDDDDHGDHAHKDDDHDHDHGDSHDDDEYLVTARWSWTCDSPKRLREVGTSFFTEYPAVEKLETIVLTDTDQVGAVLTSKKASIELP